MKILLIGGLGYIGSYIYERFSDNGYQIDICDAQVRGNKTNAHVNFEKYQDIPENKIKEYDAILWFAGHSSVQQSITDPYGALNNNCIDLLNFARKISRNTKFIYASTASLYSSTKSTIHPSSEISLVTIPNQNYYDISKFTFDYLAGNYLENFYGIRMGTLSGYSPNLRSELVFNSMNLSARKNGYLKLKNLNSQRTILFLDDLWMLINALISGNHAPGFYNAGSYSFSLSELAKIVANTWSADIVYEGESPTYSFILDCTKMEIICCSQLKKMTISERCVQFIEEFEKKEKF